MQHPECNEKRDENGRRLPMRVHELMGVSKNAWKLKNLDRTSTVQRVLPQPVLVKDLIASEKSCRKSQPIFTAGQRTNAVTPGRSILGQLYRNHSKERVPNQASSNITFLIEDYGGTEKTVLGPNFTTFTTNPISMSGISKSEGKVKNKIDHYHREPQRTKDLMKSWEKCQTVHHPARRTQCTVGNVRTKTARRKLYSVFPSPKLSRKSIAARKIKPDVKQHSDHEETSEGVEAKTSKSVVQKPRRKSCLLPPNSIRDKYIKHKANESIRKDFEDITEISEDNETLDASKFSLRPKKSMSKDEYVTNDPHTDDYHREDVKEIENAKEDNIDLDKSNVDNDFVEVPRPTVIMGLLSAKASRKSQSNDSNESKKSSEYAIKFPPAQESNESSLPRLQRIDATSTSFEDLLGKSCLIFDTSPNNLNKDLPYTSFLEHTESKNKSLMNIDRQSLLWLHENCKRTIDFTEESLFSMKRMLNTIEGILEMKPSNDLNQENVADIEGDEPKIEQMPNAQSTTISKILMNNISVKESNSHMPLTERNTNALLTSAIEMFDAGNDKQKNDNEDKENIHFDDNIANLEPSPKCMEDSFLKIEKSLNIRTSPMKQTVKNSVKPVQCKTVDSRSRKSIREYMAMKATIAFLQTPDAKGLLTPADEKDTPSRRKTMKRSISRHLLTQLHDLYDESPETN